MRIISIDFETANRSPLSACSLGLAIFESGCGFSRSSESELRQKPQPLIFNLIASPYWLIKPPKGHGWFIPEWTKDIHGLSWFDVQDAATFDIIAPDVITHLSTADLVIAHNAPFDLKVLHHLLDHHQIPIPTYRHACTLQLARKVWPALSNHKLSTLAAHIGCELSHHHASSDAIAAGRIMLAMMSVNPQLLTDIP